MKCNYHVQQVYNKNFGCVQCLLCLLLVCWAKGERLVANPRIPPIRLYRVYIRSIIVNEREWAWHANFIPEDSVSLVKCPQTSQLHSRTQFASSDLPLQYGNIWFALNSMNRIEFAFNLSYTRPSLVSLALHTRQSLQSGSGCCVRVQMQKLHMHWDFTLDKNTEN